MKSNPLLLIISFLLLPFLGVAQINDCSLAQVVCGYEDITFNPEGPGINDFADPDNDEGCMTALEQNSAWYYFEIDPTAPAGLTLGFTILPAGGLGEDYDFALYGPDVDCGNLGSPTRCSSASGACDFCPETGLGMGATDITEGPGTGDGFVMTIEVEPGQGYYLLIDNWAGTSVGFTLTWTGTAADYLNCDAVPPCSLYAVAGDDISACIGDTAIPLNGESTGGNGNETFVWSGTNGGTNYLSNPNIKDPLVNLPPDFTGTIIYTLLVTEDTCIGEDMLELVVYDLPVIDISQVAPLCQNDPPQTLIASPSGGTWSGAATGNTFNPMINGPGIHKVYYAYTDGNNCSAMDSMEIEVFEIPALTINPDPAEFCASIGSILLTAVGTDGAGGFSYNWDTPSGAANGDTYDANSAGDHYVTVTDANGCTNSAFVEVIIIPDPIVQIVDPGPICDNVDFIVLEGQPAGGTFSGGIISPFGEIYPSTVPPGIYTIGYAFTDQFNCSGETTLDIIIIAVPDAIASNNGPLCQNESILLFGESSGGGSNVSYFWMGPNGYTSTQQNPTNAPFSGDYSLQVIVDGCFSDPTVTTVEIGVTPDVIVANEGPYCNGQAIQLIGATSTSGSIISYSWTGPNGYISDTQNPGDAVEDGIYSLIVTVDGCASEIGTTDVVFTVAPDALATNDGPICEGALISLFGNTNSGGNQVAYSWTGPNGFVSTDQNPTDIAEAGVYELIVIVDGCESEIEGTIVIINPLPEPEISGQNMFCTDNSAIIDAGENYDAYLWEDGSVSQELEVFDGGIYSVTVTDDQGCVGSTSFEVTELASLAPVILGVLEFCEGSSTTLDIEGSFSSFEWTTGEMDQTIDITDSGNYGVIVTDEEGCSGSTNVNVIANNNPVVTIGGSTSYCIGGSTILDAGDGYVDYIWNNDSTSQTITISSPGDYEVTVIDSNGCSGFNMVSVEESTSLSPVITGNEVFCENGNAVLNAGSGFDSYTWSNGTSDQILTVNVAGDYSVTVSDVQGCSGEATISISEALPPEATLQTQAELCNTEAGGSIINLYDLVLSGDINGNWEDVDNSGAVGFFNNLNFNNIDAGIYTFMYTTNSAVTPCPESSYEVAITILDCTCPDVFFLTSDPLCNASDILDLTTIENTTEEGIWTMIQTPIGSNPATFNGTLLDVTGSDIGSYVFQFSLLSQSPPGCPIDFEYTLTVDEEVSAGVPMQTIAYCFQDIENIMLASLINGEDLGGSWEETSVSMSQGNAFDSINGTFIIDNQQAGMYTFIYVKASNGACPSDTAEVSILINPIPNIELMDADELGCNNLIQNLDATGSSNGADFDIEWVGPGLIQDGQENGLTPNVDQPGIYVLTITNTLTGCSNSESLEVIENADAPSGALITSEDPYCYGDENAFIMIDQVLGGEAPYVFSFDNGPFSSESFFDNLSGGNYTLALEDANGCKWDTTIVINAPNEITLDIGPDIELGLGENASVQAIINIALNQIDTLFWDPDDIIDCIDPPCLEILVNPNNSVGLTLTVIDQNGCEITDALFIELNKNRRVYIPSAFSPNNDQINDVFYIFGDASQIKNITKFLIFDRWGGVMHEVEDINPNDPNTGWKGNYNSRQVNPGVYLYVAEIEFIDGVVEQFTGDVTLLK